MIRKTYDGVYFKALDDSTGEFEAVVSVFGNVDLQGDRGMPGMFAKSLDMWRTKGDPIPVIWSHEWGNPMAHIGYVLPEDAYEVLSGDSEKAMGDITGGLFVKGHLDVDKPFAKQVYDLLKDRRVTEWSFAYDVVDEERNTKDHANELNEVNLFEVGPTLKGANPATSTLGVKSVLDRAAFEDRSLRMIVKALDTDPDVGLKYLRDWVRDEKSGLDVPAAELKDVEFKWDGQAAMQSCSSAADFRKIAFERDNDSDPDTAAHWALPHHPSPGADADPQGVSSALGALSGARGGAPDLKDASAARAHLEAHGGGEGKNEDDVETKDQNLSDTQLREHMATDHGFLEGGVLLEFDGAKLTAIHDEMHAGDGEYENSTEKSDESSTLTLTTTSTSSNGTLYIPVTTPVEKAGRAISKETEDRLRRMREDIDAILSSVEPADEEKSEDDADDKSAALEELEEYKRRLGLLDT